MKGWKILLQALAGLILAAAAAVAVGTWVFPGESDLIMTLSGLRISVSGIGAGLALLTILGFADGWILAENRRDPEDAGPGRTLDGIGFGLLLGIAVWKIFEQYTMLGRGQTLTEGFPAEGWFAEGGAWLPGRLEFVCALVLFAAVTLWLILRRESLPGNGDLAGVCLAGWSAARMVTEAFRASQIGLLGESRIVGWLAVGVMALTLAAWTARLLRQKRNTGYALACVPVFVVSVAGVVLIQNQVIWTGNAVADLIMQCAFALLALKAVLCIGRVSRWRSRPNL